MPTIERAEKLLREAIQNGDCLECQLTPSQVYANVKGYGKAHRYIWEVYKGKIEPGVLICHSCDNPRCINLEHLFAGTPLDNMLDKVAKGRQHFGGPGQMLSIRLFQNIVEMRYAGSTYDTIGDKYGVSRRTVQRFLESCPHD